ncbi:uncharacterized protein FOMMEDRAFT_160087 [Fomitiporia mediterranea MF3/22]|uniref:uncharacterized protein n=1 Tax=Fomitiporia mediterranea (strain MF3/22) TaxID=694068 RepID=UPI0004407735|nr:uncharacterized protein FOMMEDRAFT_160087 [Fomitiporia mediterranea MF3/22]EJC99661.1 hypothetical protein FOMMEDRAFT_160087 [Fomitiporia mediterranea MF3/22]
MDRKSVSPGHSDVKREGNVEVADRLSAGGVSGGSLLPFNAVSCPAQRKNARGVAYQKDVVTSRYSSSVACAAEREVVRECMELLKKSFGIGQQCGCANANAKRKASVKKEDNEGGATQDAEQGAGGMEGRQTSWEERDEQHCAGYYGVDWLLTLYVEGRCSQVGGIIAGSEAQHGHRSSGLERRVK